MAYLLSMNRYHAIICIIATEFKAKNVKKIIFFQVCSHKVHLCSAIILNVERSDLVQSNYHPKITIAPKGSQETLWQ